MGYQLRRYTDDDEAAVLKLLTSRFESWRDLPDSRAFFRWKHLDNPFGRSVMSVAVHRDEVVAFRAFLRWKLVKGGRPLEVARGADAATAEGHERRGLWESLTREDLTVLPGLGIEMAIAHGNELSRAGYLKLGWTIIGKTLAMVTPARRRISRCSDRGDGGRTRPLASTRVASELLDRLGSTLSSESHWCTPRVTAFLRWRYLDVPFPGHVTTIVDSPKGGVAIAFGRIRERGSLRELRLLDVVHAPHHRSAGRLAMSASRRTDADYVVGQGPSTARGLVERGLRGWLPWPARRTPVLATSIGGGAVPGWSDLDLSLGDLETYF